MRKNLPVFGVLCAIFLFLLLISKFVTPSNAAATHIVISEIQISDNTGSNSADFIELYNPTDADINMGDLRLVKRTSSGTTDSGIIAFSAAHIIPAHGYFLWCNMVLLTSLNCDVSTTATIGSNNSIGLRMDPAETGTLIDAVTLGVVTNPLGEGTPLMSPTDGASVERKANVSSTTESMTSGIDMLLGNAYDTDQNFADFIKRTISLPQHQSSDKEPLPISPTATITLSPSPTLTSTPTPTLTPSPTLSPTMSPTVTMTPTLTPTNTPTPTITVTPPATLTPTPTTKPPFYIPKYKLVCSPKTISFTVLTRVINVSYPICNVIVSR